MNLEYLAHFLIIADQMNFTKAARELHFSQSTLSRQMASLEKQLGYELFMRDGHAFQLTEAGEILAREGKSLINQMGQMKDRIGEAVQQKKELRLSISVIATVYIFELCKAFLKKYPDITLTLENRDGTSEIYSALIDDETDFAMLNSYEIGEVQAQSDNCSYRLVWKDRMCVIVGRDHPLAAKGSCTISDLQSERILHFGPTSNPHWNYIAYACSDRQFFPQPQKQYTAKNKDTMNFLVMSGFGVAFMAREIAKSNHPDFVVVEIEDLAIDIDFMLVWKKNPTNPATRLFVEFMDQFLKT